MNADVAATDPAIHYYDGDYPSSDWSEYSENFDSTTEFQGIAHDVPRYEELAKEHGSPILELCCGTGRVSLPLAHRGFSVVGVDICAAMLDRFRENLHRRPPDARKRVDLVHSDVCELSLGRSDFPLAIVPFNSLLCIPDFGAQRRALRSIAQHLAPGGHLILDLVNPLALKIQGDPVPKPFFTRKNPHTGNTYTRFAMCDPFDDDHRQRLHGWYDEVDQRDGTVKRTSYALHWRPIFRFEIELMLKESGLSIVTLEGGHRREPYTAKSDRMFVVARKEQEIRD